MATNIKKKEENKKSKVLQPKTLQEVLDTMNKSRPGTIFTGADLERAKNKRASVGIPSVDRILGGGMVRGGKVHIYGKSGTGKSTLTIQTGANIQRMDKFATGAVVNLEGFWRTEGIQYAKKFGMDPERVIILEMGENEGSENVLDTAIQLVKTRALDFLIVDSIAGIITRDELEKSMDENEKIAFQANLVKKFLLRLNAVTAPRIENGEVLVHPCAIMIINQLRAGGLGYVLADKNTPGGSALHFFSDIEVHASRVDPIFYKVQKDQLDLLSDSLERRELEKGWAIGHSTQYKIHKNRTAPTEDKATVIDFYRSKIEIPSPTGFTGFGFDLVGDTFDTAVLAGIIPTSGAYRTIEGKTYQGREKALTFFRSSPEVYQRTLKQLEDIGKDDTRNKEVKSKVSKKRENVVEGIGHDVNTR